MFLFSMNPSIDVFKQGYNPQGALLGQYCAEVIDANLSDGNLILRLRYLEGRLYDAKTGFSISNRNEIDMILGLGDRSVSGLTGLVLRTYVEFCHRLVGIRVPLFSVSET